MDREGGPIKGRGTRDNPAGRFEPLDLQPDLEHLEHDEEEPPDPRTRYYRDTSRAALATNQSPDVGYDTSLNPYRGCEHGCSYCFARPFHEYLGLSAGLDFETKIFVKQDAPELLRRELGARSWKPQVVAMSGVTDPYQPIERKLAITRRCLEVMAEFRNPVGIVTKSRLVARDADVLGELAKFGAASVVLSVTTLDADLARVMEPRAAQPAARLAAIRALADAGIPVGVSVAPVIPGLTEHEIPRILEAAAGAGARFAGWVMLRLPFGVKELFEQWLADHRPDRRQRVLARVRDVRGGQLYDSRFGKRQRGEGKWAEQIRELFELSRRRAGLAERGPELSAAAFRRPGGEQLGLL
jgi:DNA repair photolyase